ncbi:MAG: hypothetical protein J0L89_09820, partial [Xanthomonadales bacterium]|nr:hypothetical protein [Xanthomonadales bacterium]
NMGPSNVVFEEVGVPQLQDTFQNETIGNSGLDRVAPVSIVAVPRRLATASWSASARWIR